MSTSFYRYIVTFGLFLASMGTFAVPARGNQLVNGDFEAPAIVGSGQTTVAPGQQKSLNIDPLHVLYPGAISQIPNWVNSYTDVACGVGCRDAGLSRINFNGSGNTQFAYINNWEMRLSQVSTWTLSPGDTIQANILIGFAGPTKAGKFQLWAGQPSASNPDQFPGSAVLLAQLSAGTTDWTNYVPNQALSVGQWHPLQLNYTVPASGPMIGKPLTLSFLTSLNSVGPTYWDNASLTAVPEPKSLILLMVTGAALAGRSWRNCSRRKVPKTEIARPLGKHSSKIYRELARNTQKRQEKRQKKLEEAIPLIFVSGQKLPLYIRIDSAILVV